MTTAVTCRLCGCTDDRACPGGCSWAEPGLCTSCLARLRQERNEAARVLAGAIAGEHFACGQVDEPMLLEEILRAQLDAQLLSLTQLLLGKGVITIDELLVSDTKAYQAQVECGIQQEPLIVAPGGEDLG